MRLNGAFVSKFLEEWSHSQDIHGSRRSWGDEHRIVERFMEAMKYELAAVIIPEVIPDAALTFPQQAHPLDPA